MNFTNFAGNDYNSSDMKAEIITIGDELLIGQVVDTNAAWLAEQLDLAGFKVCRITSVSDKLDTIKQALAEAGARSSLVLLTGGLGPTKDDITKKALGEFFDMPLKTDPEVLENIRQVISRKLGVVNGLNEQQAIVPEGCTVFQNTIGTAPVMWFNQKETVYVSMPGVPFEMRHLMREKVIPAIKRHFKTPVIIHKTVLTTGIPEAVLAEKLEPWENALPENVKLAYLPSPGRNRLRLTGFGSNATEIANGLNRQIEKLYAYIPEAIFGFDDESLEQVVGDLLRENKLTLATAESCTGGNIARLVTAVPGASLYFAGGAVAYSNAIKQKDLQVPEELLIKHGAVSEQVVRAMATGAQNHFNTDFTVAVTGIAGPGGGSPEKPVGTVWFAVATPQKVVAQKLGFGDNRNRNIIRSTATAFNMLRLQVLQYLGLGERYHFQKSKDNQQVI